MKRIFCFTLCLILMISFCGCSVKKDNLTQAVIKYNLEFEPKSLDPQIATDYPSKIIITNLFEGLCKIDTYGNIVPGVAESWTSTENGKSFIFNLRSDSFWSDNEKTPVTSKDFVFALRRALDPLTGSDAGKALYAIKNAQNVHSGVMDLSDLGVYAIDDKTLKIDLEYEYNEFPKLMATTVSFPCNEAFFKKTGGQYGLECEYVLSNGAYKFTNRYSWEHNKNISLSRRENYHNREGVIPSGIDFIIDTSTSNNVNSILSGSVDCSGISSDNLQTAIKNNMNLAFFEDTTWGLCFNLDNSIFSNDDIRKAFVKSLSRDYILKDLPESYDKADGIIPPDTTIAGVNYREVAGDNQIDFSDSEDIKELINSGLRQIDRDNMPNVTVLCLDSSQSRLIVSSMLELWNKNLGTYFNMNPLPQDELESAIYSSSYQMALVPVRAENDGPFEFLSIFKSDNKNNPVNLKSADYDSILDQVFENLGLNSVPYCLEGEQYLIDNDIFYPLFFEKRCFASAFNVSDVIFYPYNGGIDFMATKKQKV